MLFETSSSTSRRFDPMTVYPKTLRKGVTNTSSGLLSGLTNIKNMRLKKEQSGLKSLTLQKGSGIRQIYHGKHAHRKLLQDDRRIGYLLDCEETPDGALIKYNYYDDHQQNDLKSIVTFNSSNVALNSLIFRYPAQLIEALSIKVTANDGRAVRYRFNKTSKGKVLLSKVISPQHPLETYEYDKNATGFFQLTQKILPNERFLNISYYQKGKNRLPFQDAIKLKSGDKRIRRVASLSAPVGSDGTLLPLTALLTILKKMRPMLEMLWVI